jgi:hypothetical protein
MNLHKFKNVEVRTFFKQKCKKNLKIKSKTIIVSSTAKVEIKTNDRIKLNKMLSNKTFLNILIRK